MITIRKFCAVSAAVVVGLAGTSTAMAKGVKEVRLQDRCDQATFDAVVGPGTCAPGVAEPVTFGGGCVDQLNIPLGLSTAPECAVIDATGAPAWLSTGVAPGASRDVTAPTKPGSYTFQCMIHPWMRLTLDVRP